MRREASRVPSGPRTLQPSRHVQNSFCHAPDVMAVCVARRDGAVLGALALGTL